MPELERHNQGWLRHCNFFFIYVFMYELGAGPARLF